MRAATACTRSRTAPSSYRRLRVLRLELDRVNVVLERAARVPVCLLERSELEQRVDRQRIVEARMLHLRHRRGRRELPVCKPRSCQRVDDRERHGMLRRQQGTAVVLAPVADARRGSLRRRAAGRMSRRSSSPCRRRCVQRTLRRQDRARGLRARVAPATRPRARRLPWRDRAESRRCPSRSGTAAVRCAARRRRRVPRAEQLIRLLERPRPGAAAWMSREAVPRFLPPHPAVALRARLDGSSC